MGGFAVGPPQFQAIGDEIACVPRGAEDHVQLRLFHLQDARRSKHRVGMHIVVGRANGFGATSLAPTREIADLHLGFGVEGDAERFRVVCGLRVDVLQMVEDGVGGGDFF